MKTKDVSFQTLIDMCNKIGWDKGITNLQQIVRNNENIQASLFAGDYSEIKQAQKLSKTIIQQNLTIGRLKQYRLEHSL